MTLAYLSTHLIINPESKSILNKLGNVLVFINFVSYTQRCCAVISGFMYAPLIFF